MVKLGVDNIDKYLDFFKGKRVGLITNPTGINSKGVSTIDILKDKVNLVALFSPEHGVRGHMQAGVRFDTYVDEETGITVYSLYTKDKKPTKEMMDKIDCLCIDIQDVGSRYYTFIYTMAYAMMSCKEYDKEFVVFDRPNPINAEDVEGNILDINYRSFVGYYPIVQRFGLTIAEVAKMFNEEFGIGCKLTTILMENYNRKMYFEDTKLLWIVPSPNMPTIDSTIAYNCTCLFEGTNVSEGRGTTKPFEYVGAPFINGKELEEKLNSLKLPGVLFRRQYFTPTFSKFQGEVCSGVALHITNRKKFKPVHTGYAMLDVIRHMYPNDFAINKPYKAGANCMLQFETGCNYILEDKYTLKEQFQILDRETEEFKNTRKKYLLY